MMSVERIIKAIQRTSHFRDAQMQEAFPELYEILFQEQLEEIGFRTQLATRSLVAQIRGKACPMHKTDK